MTWIIFAILTVFSFVFGFPAAEYAVHGWHSAFWPTGVSMPGTWFTVMVHSYGLDCLRVYHSLALGQTASFGALGLPVLACIVAGPFTALVSCFLPQVAIDARDGTLPFWRPRDTVLVMLLIVAMVALTAKIVQSTPEKVIGFSRPIALNLTYADGHSEPFALPEGGPISMMGHMTPALIRLRVWNGAYGYGIADISEDMIRPLIRF